MSRSGAGRRKRSPVGRVARAVGLIAFLLFAIFPFYWALVTSLKPDPELFTFPVRYWPQAPTLEHYASVLSNSNFLAYFRNSLVVATGTSVVVVIVAVLSGYSLARFRFRGRLASTWLFLATQMFPGVLFLGPLYGMFVRLHLLDRLLGLILIYATLNIPFTTFLMRGFYEQIPREIEEAAVVDGCTRLQAIWRVLVPVLWPGLAASFSFVFVAAWSELLFAVMFIHSDGLRTIPVGLSLYVGKFNISWGEMMAASVIALMPVMVMFGVIQRYLVQGLSLGAVKG